MPSQSSYTYTAVGSRPLADTPYESDDEAALKRRAIRSDHPPTDIHRTASRFNAPPPPAGVIFFSAVVVCAGFLLVALGLGWGWGSMRVVWVALRWLCGGTGAFCVVSGSYTLYESVFHDATRYEGGYLFPSYNR